VARLKPLATGFPSVLSLSLSLSLCLSLSLSAILEFGFRKEKLKDAVRNETYRRHYCQHIIARQELYQLSDTLSPFFVQAGFEG
jgi:hypothetical protein